MGAQRCCRIGEVQQLVKLTFGFGQIGAVDGDDGARFGVGGFLGAQVFDGRQLALAAAGGFAVGEAAGALDKRVEHGLGAGEVVRLRALVGAPLRPISGVAATSSRKPVPASPTHPRHVACRTRLATHTQSP